MKELIRQLRELGFTVSDEGVAEVVIVADNETVKIPLMVHQSLGFNLFNMMQMCYIHGFKEGRDYGVEL